MVSIYGLLSDEQRITCSRFQAVGTVTKVEFDNRRRLLAFTINTRKRAMLINLTESEAIESADLKKLPTLVKQGARLRVTAYGCGASAAILEADTIAIP